MTREEAFSDFYKSLSPQLHALNKLRKTPGIILTITRSFIFFGFLLIWVAFLFSGDDRIECIVAGTVIIITAIILSLVSKRRRKKYFAFLRLHIFPPLIEYISPDLKYNHDDGILEATFDVSDMFDHDVEFISSSDMIAGSLNGNHVRASYIRAEQMEGNSSADFRVFMFVMPFPEIDDAFDVTIDYNDNLEVSPGEILSRHGELVEKLEGLLRTLKKNINLQASISFRRSYMFLSATISKNPFKIDPNEEITEQSLFKIYDFLNVVFSTYKELTIEKTVPEI
jgi:hypothetical protein